MWLCFFLCSGDPHPPLLDHCQWESPSNPRCCLARHRLTLPPHICMSCGVSAEVCSDVMGPDGNIFPADRAIPECSNLRWVCVSCEPALHVMGLYPGWLVSPLHLSESSVTIQHGSRRFMGQASLLHCSLCSVSLGTCPHFVLFSH